MGSSWGLMRLTDISIQKLKPTEKQVVYYDDQLANFGLRVGKRCKTFVVKVGKNRSIKSIGQYPSTSLKNARIKAKTLLLDTNSTLPNTAYSAAIQSFLEDAETRNRPETIRQYRIRLQMVQDVVICCLMLNTHPVGIFSHPPSSAIRSSIRSHKARASRSATV